MLVAIGGIAPNSTTMAGYLQLSGGFAPVRTQTFIRHAPDFFPVVSPKGQPSFQTKNTPYILRSPGYLSPRRIFISSSHDLHSSVEFGHQTMKDLPASVKSFFSGKPLLLKLLPAIAVIVFTLWGLRPLLRWGINMVYHPQDNSNYSMSDAASDFLLCVFQPLLLWLCLSYVFRVLVLIVVQTESKVGLLNFAESSSAVFASGFFATSVLKQTKRYLVAANDSNDMAFQYAGKCVHIAVWVAVASLLMEMFGLSTQKWLTAGILGLVLLVLAPRQLI